MKMNCIRGAQRRTFSELKRERNGDERKVKNIHFMKYIKIYMVMIYDLFTAGNLMNIKRF